MSGDEWKRWDLDEILEKVARSGRRRELIDMADHLLKDKDVARSFLVNFLENMWAIQEVLRTWEKTEPVLREIFTRTQEAFDSIPEEVWEHE